jgi:hypothetical protein
LKPHHLEVHVPTVWYRSYYPLLKVWALHYRSYWSSTKTIQMLCSRICSLFSEKRSMLRLAFHPSVGT